MSNEEWRPVVGYEGLYEVSDHGRVRSLDREVRGRAGRTYRRRGKVRRPGIATGGYHNVDLSCEGARRTHNIHVLVAEVFIGPRPEGCQVCHNDGNPANNHVSNLRYDTPKENQADRIKHDTHIRGDRHHQAKLSWPIVREIRARYAAGGVTQRKLAADYGVSQRAINRIVNKLTWTHDPLETP